MQSNPSPVILPSFRFNERTKELIGQAVSIPQQIASLQRQQSRVWHEIMASVRAEFDAGRITRDDLIDMMEEARDVYGGGYSVLWASYMPDKISALDLRTESDRRRKFLANRPNGPAPDVWVGTIPECWKAPMPLVGEAVVYMLFDADGEPLYAGSSGTFRTRLKTHLKEKPGIVSWAAVLCADREDAYQREDEILKLRLPRYNRKASR